MAASERLGPYEIVVLIGAGGMGEVYRARDPRLGRDVAIKVLPASEATGERIQRLEREARAVGSLNHPNILAVFDVGTDDGRPYIVSELLEGETIRERLIRGAIPVRRAIDYAVQIADGLAAAHEKGICHRDLKPDNVFITTDGRVKILDFGLAKFFMPAPQPDEPVSARMSELSTESGVVLGTTAYMSPEQVRGDEADARSDLFAFGAVLYAMVAGRHAFKRETSVDTLHAILHDEPTDLPQDSALSTGYSHIVRRCLEKRAEERFQSARDLAFHLKELQAVWATTHPNVVAGLRGRRLGGRVTAIAVAMLLGGLLAAAAVMALWALPRAGPPRFRQLTFHRGTLSAARFGPDGRSILFSAAWDGQPSEIHLGLAEGPESRPLGFPGARLLAASRSGEMALLLRQRHAGAERFPGILARVPLAGGAPREVVEGVEDADWGPADQLALVRAAAGHGSVSTLEFPGGRVLHRTSGSVRHVRVRPQGDQLAFIDDPSGYSFGGTISVADERGAVRALTRRWSDARGLAWAPNGSEVWFTAADEGEPRALWAVTLDGRLRIVTRNPSSLTLHDLSSDGRALMAVDDERRGVIGRAAGDAAERDLSWFDRSGLADLSRDGRRLLIGDRLGVYLREITGSPAVRLGDGFANSLSVDGRWAVATSRLGDRIVLLPTGPGEPRSLVDPAIVAYESAWLLADGARVLFNGREQGKPMRSYLQPVAGGAARAITPAGLWSAGPAADPGWIITMGEAAPLSLFPLDGGEGRPIPGSRPGDRLAGWTDSGDALWVFRRGELPVAVDRIDVAKGARTAWRALQPADPAGVVFVSAVRVTPDGGSYAYSYRRVLSDLFLVEGLR